MNHLNQMIRYIEEFEATTCDSPRCLGKRSAKNYLTASSRTKKRLSF